MQLGMNQLRGARWKARGIEHRELDAVDADDRDLGPVVTRAGQRPAIDLLLGGRSLSGPALRATEGVVELLARDLLCRLRIRAWVGTPRGDLRDLLRPCALGSSHRQIVAATSR